MAVLIKGFIIAIFYIDPNNVYIM